MSVLCRNRNLFIYVKVSNVYQTRTFFLCRSFIGKQISLVFLTCYTRILIKEVSCILRFKSHSKSLFVHLDTVVTHNVLLNCL